MELSPIVALAVVAVGSASGVLSGMIGIGGAVITTPGIRFLGATPIEAVGSTIPAILPGAVAGAVHYHRAGLVLWPAALVVGSVGTGFSVLGAWLSDVVDANLLMLGTAGLVGLSALKTWRDRQAAEATDEAGAVADADDARKVGDRPGGGRDPDRPGGDRNPDRPRGDPSGSAPPGERRSVGAQAGLGASAGMLAGLLGVGGGLVLVPGLTQLLRLEPKRAVATSLPAVAIFSIPAMATHAVLGHVNWSYALLLTLGVVPGARLGARFTIGGSESRLRAVMSVFFGLLAVVYAGRELNEVL